MPCERANPYETIVSTRWKSQLGRYKLLLAAPIAIVARLASRALQFRIFQRHTADSRTYVNKIMGGTVSEEMNLEDGPDIRLQGLDVPSNAVPSSDNRKLKIECVQ